MEFRIRNLGKIKKANIKLGNLTVFVGKNNTNKTWTAYLIYSVFSNHMVDEFMRTLILKRSDAKIKKDLLNLTYYIKSLNKAYNENILDPLDIAERFDKEISRFVNLKDFITKTFLKEYTKLAVNRFGKFILHSKSIDNLKVSLKISNSKVKEVRKNLRSLIFTDNFKLEKEEDIYIYWSDVKVILNSIVNTLFNEPFNIPAERNALIFLSNLIYIGESNLEKTKMYVLDKIIENEIDEKFLKDVWEKTGKYRYNYPYAINQFKDFMFRVGSLSEIDEPENRELIHLLENSILEGRLEVEEYTGKINYITQDTILDISSSSSMVKGLAALHLYIKYLAKKGDILIIDEPEMNLHPEAQVKLIEFLTILANKGIKVLITTHSPYIVDHIINLIEGFESKKENKEDLFWETKYIKTGKYKEIKPTDVFISKNDISVYFFKENGEVESIINKEDTSIDWSTFSNISTKVSQIYWEL